jgi:hypothetical protein
MNCVLSEPDLPEVDKYVRERVTHPRTVLVIDYPTYLSTDRELFGMVAGTYVLTEGIEHVEHVEHVEHIDNIDNIDNLHFVHDVPTLKDAVSHVPAEHIWCIGAIGITHFRPARVYVNASNPSTLFDELGYRKIILSCRCVQNRRTGDWTDCQLTVYIREVCDQS